MREYRGSLALEALSKRVNSKQLAPLRTTSDDPRPRPSSSKQSNLKVGKPASRSLFLDEDDTEEVQDADEDDPSFMEAVQRSIEDSEQREAEELSAALAESAAEADNEDLQRTRQFHSSHPSVYSGSTYVTLMSRMDGPAAKFAAVRNAAVGDTSSHFASPTRAPSASHHNSLGSPKAAKQSTPSPSIKRSPTASGSPTGGRLGTKPPPKSPLVRRPSGASDQTRSDVPVDTPTKNQGALINKPIPPLNALPAPDRRSSRPPGPVMSHEGAGRITATPSSASAPIQTIASSEQDLGVVLLTSTHQPTSSLSANDAAKQSLDAPFHSDTVSNDEDDIELISVQRPSMPHPPTAPDDLPRTPRRSTTTALPVIKTTQRTPDDERFADDQLQTQTRDDDKHAHNEWDAAEEIDVAAEQAQFASFFSQVQNRSVDQLREEIDKELRGLQAQKKAAMRDSEDITQQMVGQIQMMLRLFGIPYVTAPMEAEAQCATLVALGLVEGIITDDSDVFLFGGQRVFRNMFNQSKTVECFLAADLARELGLDRDSLVRLAYLLGSDYTDGLPGVGPVLAMELLKEFPGEDGLHRFKDWWRKVQSGRDRPEDSSSPFRRRFVGAVGAVLKDLVAEVETLQKKRFKDLHLGEDWPPPVVVNLLCPLIAFVNIQLSFDHSVTHTITQPSTSRKNSSYGAIQTLMHCGSTFTVFKTRCKYAIFIPMLQVLEL